METKSWQPSLTSQFLVCPVPFHLDTYRGCVYNCNYCFARDFVTFSRRNSEHRESTYLVANDSESFARWMNRVDKASGYDYARGNEVAIKERIPLKIGATSDPCPPVESQSKVTYQFLKILDYFDYPVEIQTKNPGVLASYAGEFRESNWVVAVTIITTDEGFRKACEPNAPSVGNRLEGIKRLTDLGIKVMVKVQPAVYPKIRDDLPALVGAIKRAGCWAFNTEGLKIRVSMPQSERNLFGIIGKYLNIDLFAYYKEHSTITGSDREIRTVLKREYSDMALSLAREYSLKYYPADNDILGMGDGCECCGTEALHDYKIWQNNVRSKAFPLKEYASKELGKCLVNFTRTKRDGQTMDDAMQDVVPLEGVAAEIPVEHREMGEGKIKECMNLGHGHECDAVYDISGILPTIRAQASSKTQGRAVLDTTDIPSGKVRRLTPVECERLQGFPDNWTEGIPDAQRYKCLGNAVTVNVIETIGRRFLVALDEADNGH